MSLYFLLLFSFKFDQNKKLRNSTSARTYKNLFF